MSRFSVKVANSVFDIKANYEETLEKCRDYLTDEAADAIIEISEKDIEKEQVIADKQALADGHEKYQFTKEMLEFTAICRKVSDWFSYNNAELFHGALIEKDGKGYLFTAKSGVGKTTHIRNWCKVYPECNIVNGDKPILKIEKDKLVGYGSPWSGKEQYQTNTSVPVYAIILLERSKDNFIHEIKFDEAMETLMTQLYRPSDGRGLLRMMNFMKDMQNKVKLYRLGCNMDKESAYVAYNGMLKKT